MNIFKLALKNIFNKPLSLIFSLLLFALGVGLINFLLLFNHQLNEKFEANLADIDLVIGAKGSPLQLILCNMYHIDNPTGNIKLKDAKMFLNPKHPLIKLAVPLSLGDSHKSFRIVGTNDNILKLYNAQLNSGKLWKKDLEVTIGQVVADKTGLKIGDHFVSSHGFNEDPDLAHEHAKFAVVGILKPTGTIIDQLILTNTASIWKMHAHEENEDGDAGHQHEEDDSHHDHTSDKIDNEKGSIQQASHVHDNSNIDLMEHGEEQITSILIQYKSKSNYAALNLPRNINENTAMQAAAPAYEINKLNDMIGIGTNTIKWIAILIALVSFISIFISLYQSMRERKYELALMRVMGSSREGLFLMIILEGVLIALIGWAIGNLLSHLGFAGLSYFVGNDFKYSFSATKFIKAEWILMAVSLFIGLFAAFIPAWSAANTDINKTLTQK